MYYIQEIDGRWHVLGARDSEYVLESKATFGTRAQAAAVASAWRRGFEPTVEEAGEPDLTPSPSSDPGEDFLMNYATGGYSHQDAQHGLTSDWAAKSRALTPQQQAVYRAIIKEGVFIVNAAAIGSVIGLETRIIVGILELLNMRGIIKLRAINDRNEQGSLNFECRVPQRAFEQPPETRSSQFQPTTPRFQKPITHRPPGNKRQQATATTIAASHANARGTPRSNSVAGVTTNSTDPVQQALQSLGNEKLESGTS